MTIFIIFISIVLYFLPSIVASYKKKKNSSAILALNFFLGWTFIGWIVSLVWSLKKDEENTVIVQQGKTTGNAEELIHLADLKAKGILTEEEFLAQKKKLLS